MNRILRTSLAAAVLAAASLPAQAQEWTPFVFSNAKDAKPDDIGVQIWRDEIEKQTERTRADGFQIPAGANAYLGIITARIDAGGKTYVVSIAATRSCQAGANNAGSDIEPNVCAVRLVKYVDGKASTTTEGTACYIDHSDPDAPTANRDDNTFAAFDAAAGILQLRTRVGGKTVAACERSIKIR